jgi:hypothetical protein
MKQHRLLTLMDLFLKEYASSSFKNDPGGCPEWSSLIQNRVHINHMY